MISISTIVREGILEIKFLQIDDTIKTYQIKNNEERVLLSGKITGNTQKTCLYIGDLVAGKYHFCLNNDDPILFIVEK